MPRTTAIWLLLAATPALPAASWTHYAGDAARTSAAPLGPTALDAPAWSHPPNPQTEYVYHSAPVAYGGRLFVNARYFVNQTPVSNILIAYDARGGGELWRHAIDRDVYDSRSSPAVDTRNGTVILGSGQRVHALDAATGQVRWQTPLERVIVNASPAVSTDLFIGGTPTNRAFITDYNGSGTSARLYALNVDPHHPVHNPHAPGDVVWSALLPGASGNSPAYHAETVYVASVGGVLFAFDARSGAPRWQTNVAAAGYPQYAGFFGGVTVRGGHVYAASYRFHGGQNNSGLFKLNAASGAIVWVHPCERTSSIPVVTGDGRIFLAGGIDGFGSAVKIQALRDLGPSAVLLWDTHAATGGALRLGGWTAQPVFADGRLYAGTPDAAAFFAPYTDLYILNVALPPTAPGFVAAHFAGAGGSPALTGGGLYSLGQAGLLAFPTVLPGDLNCDAAVNSFDVDAFVLALTDPAAYAATYPDCTARNADANRDGHVNAFDIDPFVALLVE